MRPFLCVLRPGLLLTAPVLPPSVVGGKPCGLCRDELSLVEIDLDYGRLAIREMRMAAWGNSHLPHCHVRPTVAKLLPHASLAGRVLGSCEPRRSPS
jgi:hypothetical protein